MPASAVVAFHRKKHAAAAEFAHLGPLPVAVMLCEPDTATVSYANDKARELLKGVAHALPSKTGDIVGASLGHFGDIPAGLIADPANLPHTAEIRLGGDVLEVHIAAIFDRHGRYAAAQITLTPTTEAQALAERTQSLLQMLDNLPINVMACDPKDFRITYANAKSLDTLRGIEEHLPIKADALIGSSIDIFHKHPTRVRTLLADPKNLPHRAQIHVGPETLELRVSAIRAKDGGYVAPMVTWSLMTENVAVAERVSGVVSDMARTSETAQTSSGRLLTLTEHTEEMAAAVSASAVEMSASFDEISRQVQRASDTSRETADKAAAADQLVAGLAESVERIGTITAMIDKIAAQTNLLALNATIEAARAGDLGKGFAVVAQEVKALAQQTARATEDIRRQVGAVQEVSGRAALAVSEITQNVSGLSEVIVDISSGVQQQASVNRSVSESITGVSNASGEIRDAALAVRSVSGEVAGFSERLRTEVAALLTR